MTEHTFTDSEIDLLLEIAPTTEMPSELRGKITHLLTESLSPVRPLPRTLILVLRFLSVFVILAAAVIAMMGIQGIASIPLWQAIGITAILCAGVILLSSAAASQMAPGGRLRIPGTTVAITFVTGFLAGVALLFPWQTASDYFSHGWPCAVTGFGLAIPTAVLIWLVARRGVPLSGATFGGTLGALAGALGVTVLQFKCIYQNAAHILLWHGGVVLLSIAGGVSIGWVVDRNRNRRTNEGSD